MKRVRKWGVEWHPVFWLFQFLNEDRHEKKPLYHKKIIDNQELNSFIGCHVFFFG